jgi:LuxR family transcriptional regulator, maltose regulon positive regulatory protein
MTSRSREGDVAALTDDRSVPNVGLPHQLALIPRPQLVTRLREARGYPLILITAPAGYAKSSLLAQWAEEDERRFALTTLETSDDRPSHLLNRLVRILDSVSSRGRPFVVGIDEADTLRSKGALAALANLIASLPPEGQIVLVSRRELALPLGRMRAHRKVFELTRRDLAMSRTESEALLRAIGLRLTSPEIEALYARTEGWPAALYLAGLSLGEGDRMSVDAMHWGGDDRFVADYIRDEFLAGISVARLRFLMRTSILEDLAGKICDDVLERTGSGRVLRELARSKLPLEPLDHADGTYRYHPLFMQTLAAELHRREPEVESNLHRRASAWYAEHERFKEAIDHATAAGDDKRAAELIWARAASYLAEGRHQDLHRWLDRFSGQEVARSPELALATAHLYLALGDGGLAAHWTSVAREAFDEAALEDADLEADLLILRATLPGDGIAQMGADAIRAGDLHPPESPWRAMSHFYAGVSLHLADDTDGARDLLEKGARTGSATAPIAQVFCLVQLTFLHMERDHLDDALRVVAHAREQLERFQLGEHPILAFFFVASALTRAHDGRIEEAAADSSRARKMLEELNGFPDWYQGEARIHLARACILLDDSPAAGELLAEAAEFAARLDDAPALSRWLSEAESAVAAMAGGGERSELTPAELRTLRFLPSHLSFREIAAQSFVSANTVKTQAQAIYRKLDATSRGEAVERARDRGLLQEASHG